TTNCPAYLSATYLSSPEERITMKKVFFTIVLILAAVAALTLPRGFHISAHEALIQQPVVINFEDLAVGPVTNQYANLGITFNQPTVLSYQSMPGFAHSGIKAIEQCYAAEFCNAPIEMSFQRPASRQSLGWLFEPAQHKPNSHLT